MTDLLELWGNHIGPCHLTSANLAIFLFFIIKLIVFIWDRSGLWQNPSSRSETPSHQPLRRLTRFIFEYHIEPLLISRRQIVYLQSRKRPASLPASLAAGSCRSSYGKDRTHCTDSVPCRRGATAAWRWRRSSHIPDRRRTVCPFRYLKSYI